MVIVKKLVIVLALFFLVLNVFSVPNSVSIRDLAIAYSGGESNWSNFYELLLKAPVELVNGTVLPEEASALVEGEIVNLHFEGESLRIVSFEVKNHTIINARDGPSKNATLYVGLKASTVKKIIYSKDMLSEFLKAKNSGEIIIKPIGLIPTIRTTIGNIFSGILGFFF